MDLVPFVATPFKGRFAVFKKMAFDRLFKVGLCYTSLDGCPAGLEPPAVSRNKRKATVKIRRNASKWALTRKGLYPILLMNKHNFQGRIYFSL